MASHMAETCSTYTKQDVLCKHRNHSLSVPGALSRRLCQSVPRRAGGAALLPWSHNSSWTSLGARRHICTSASHSRISEHVAVLQLSDSKKALAYVVGVPVVSQADATSAAAQQQIEQLLQHLRQQQQKQDVVLLLDATATAVAGKAFTQQPHEYEKVQALHPQQQATAQQQQLQRLQDMLIRLAAEHGLSIKTQQQQQQQHRPQGAGQQNSSSSKSLLSGLGQAGRAAAIAASAAAAAVLDAVENAANAANAAISAAEHTGVDLAADLPDIDVRPRSFSDWGSREEILLGWQASLTFCALLAQLEAAGFDVEITAEENSMFGGSSSDSDDEEVLGAILQAEGLWDDKDDDDDEESEDQDEDGEDKDEVGGEQQDQDNSSGSSRADSSQGRRGGKSRSKQLTGSPVGDFAASIAAAAAEAEAAGDTAFAAAAATAAAAAAAAAADGDFTPLGMRLDEEGNVLIIGRGKDGSIEAWSGNFGSSSSSDGEDSSSGRDSGSSNGQLKKVEGVDMENLLEASGLPPFLDQPTRRSSSSASSSRKRKAKSSSKSKFDGLDALFEQLLSESDATFSKDSSSSSSSSSNDKSSGSAEAAGNSSSGGTAAGDSAAADAARARFFDAFTAEAGDRVVGPATDPYILNAMMQLERSWTAGNAGGGSSSNKDATGSETSSRATTEASDGSSSSSYRPGRMRRKPDPSAAAAAAAAAATAASGSEGEQELPELLPKPVRPTQNPGTEADSSSSGGGVDSSGSSQEREALLAAFQSARKEAAAAAAAEAGAGKTDSTGNIDDSSSSSSSTASVGDTAAAQQVSNGLSQQHEGPDLAVENSTSSTSSSSDCVKSLKGGTSGMHKADALNAEVQEESNEAEGEQDSEEYEVDEAWADEFAMAMSGMFQKFEQQLDAAGLKLDMDEKIELFGELYLNPSDSDSDSDNEDDSSSSQQQRRRRKGSDGNVSAAAPDDDDDGDVKSSNADPSSSSGSSSIAAAAAKLPVSSSSSKGSSSSSAPAGFFGPGWEQLSRMVDPAQLSRLFELLKGGSIRMKHLDPPAVQLFMTALNSLQQGELLSSPEIEVLLHVLDQAESVPETEELDLSETLKSRTRALKRQRAAARAGINRRATALGFNASAKDKAYKQNTRNLRVPKSTGRARGERAKQLLKVWRQRQQQRLQQRLDRQALQAARQQLNANMAASSGSLRSSGAAADVRDGSAIVSSAAAEVAAAGKGGSWKATLAKMRSALQKAVVEQQPAAGTTAANQPGASAANQQQEQLAGEAAVAALVQQMQEAAAPGAGENVNRRVVIALVPQGQLPYIEQEWEKL